MRHIEQSGCGSAIKRLVRGDAGSGLVEYALIFMLFMSMLLGIADFARALYADHYVSNAARDASRWAAVNGSTCADDGSCASPASSGTIQSFVTNNVPLGIDSSQLTVSSSWPFAAGACATTPKAPGCLVQVTVQYKFNFVFPFVSNKTLTFKSVSQTVILH
jgi:Flp pilus assembly protein TadG